MRHAARAYRATSHLQLLAARDFVFERAPADVVAQAPERTQTHGLHAMLADFLAGPPVFGHSDQNQTSPHVGQEQTLLLAVVAARHTILVEAKCLLCARMRVEQLNRKFAIFLALTRLLLHPATRGFTYAFQPENDCCRALRPLRCGHKVNGLFSCNNHFNPHVHTHAHTFMPSLNLNHAPRWLNLWSAATVISTAAAAATSFASSRRARTLRSILYSSCASVR